MITNGRQRMAAIHRKVGGKPVQKMSFFLQNKGMRKEWEMTTEKYIKSMKMTEDNRMSSCQPLTKARGENHDDVTEIKRDEWDDVFRFPRVNIDFRFTSVFSSWKKIWFDACFSSSLARLCPLLTCSNACFEALLRGYLTFRLLGFPKFSASVRNQQRLPWYQRHLRFPNVYFFIIRSKCRFPRSICVIY